MLCIFNLVRRSLSWWIFRLPVFVEMHVSKHFAKSDKPHKARLRRVRILQQYGFNWRSFWTHFCYATFCYATFCYLNYIPHSTVNLRSSEKSKKSQFYFAFLVSSKRIWFDFFFFKFCSLLRISRFISIVLCKVCLHLLK